MVAVGVDEADEVKERREEGLDVSELLALQVLEVRGQRLEMCCDILSLFHCPDHVPVRGETDQFLGKSCELKLTCTWT